jgi:hypothetical protein
MSFTGVIIHAGVIIGITGATLYKQYHVQFMNVAMLFGITKDRR